MQIESPIQHVVVQVELLLLIAATVAILARKLRMPYSVGLVLAGIALAYAKTSIDIRLSRELIFTALLPPLIFEAAFALHWDELRKDLWVVLTLASFGVVLSAGVTAVGMHFLADWSWPTASILGVLIAATDPVSVIATFKEAGVHGRLRLLVEAESLFNDGTAAVLFGIALSIAAGVPQSVSGIAVQLVMTIGGGILCGALTGAAVLLLAGRTDDHLVEITFTSVAAYASFLLAEHFQLSGVLSTLTTGLLLGNVGSLGAITDRGRDAVLAFWEYIAFIANSLIFLLIGIQEANQQFVPLLGAMALAIVLGTVGRAVAIYPLSWLFRNSRLRIDSAYQHVLFWGGLRGALALALVLGLPPTMPGRAMLVTVTFGVVAFSVFAQGTTMTPMLRRSTQRRTAAKAPSGGHKAAPTAPTSEE